DAGVGLRERSGDLLTRVGETAVHALVGLVGCLAPLARRTDGEPGLYDPARRLAESARAALRAPRRRCAWEGLEAGKEEQDAGEGAELNGHRPGRLSEHRAAHRRSRGYREPVPVGCVTAPQAAGQYAAEVKKERRRCFVGSRVRADAACYDAA